MSSSIILSSGEAPPPTNEPNMPTSETPGGEALQSLRVLASWASDYRRGLGLSLALALALPASQSSAQGRQHVWHSSGVPGPRILVQQPVGSEAGGGSFDSFLLLVGAAYFYGLFGPRATNPSTALHNSDDQEEEKTGGEGDFSSQSSSRDQISDPTSLKNSWEILQASVGSYVKVAVGIALVFPFPLQPALYCLLVVVISAVSLLAPTSRLHGPLRYGYFESGRQLHQFWDLASPWLLYAGGFIYAFPTVADLFFPNTLLTLTSLLLAPTLSLSVAGFAAAWYIRTYRAYVAKVAEVSASSSELISDVTATASHAQALVVSARSYEKQLSELVALRRRDATRALTLHATDFFDVAACAWSALRQITDPATNGARLVEEAIAMRDDMSDDEEQSIMEKGQQDVVTEVMNQLNVAQAAVNNCESAKTQFNQGRDTISRSAADATSQIALMREATDSLEEWLYMAVTGAERIKAIAERARVVAAEGEISEAKKLVEKARSEKEKVEEDSIERLRAAEERSRDLLFSLLQKS